MEEKDLYNPICRWLESYLHGNYRKAQKIIVEDVHSITLENALRRHGLQHSKATDIDIEIDVLGIVQYGDDTFELVFVEAKKNALTLRDLGQLWAYCTLIDPIEAFLLSPGGLGTLGKVLQTFKRVDMLKFGSGKKFKSMKVAKWNLTRQSPDMLDMIGNV